MTKEQIISIFFSTLHLCISQPILLKTMTYKEKKRKGNPNSFPFKSFLKGLKVKGLKGLTSSVVSNSFATPWTVVHQAPLPMGILQARILAGVAMSPSRGSSQPRD